MTNDQQLKPCPDRPTPFPWKVDGYDIWHQGESYDSKTDPHLYTGITIDPRLRNSRTAITNLEVAVKCVNAASRSIIDKAQLLEWLKSKTTGAFYCTQKEAFREVIEYVQTQQENTEVTDK